MTLQEIRSMPTTHGEGSERIHESILRSYHILCKAEELLVRGTPADVVLEVIGDLRGDSRPGTYIPKP